jgi:hypothetical protein
MPQKNTSDVIEQMDRKLARIHEINCAFRMIMAQWGERPGGDGVEQINALYAIHNGIEDVLQGG